MTKDKIHQAELTVLLYTQWVVPTGPCLVLYLRANGCKYMANVSRLQLDTSVLMDITEYAVSLLHVKLTDHHFSIYSGQLCSLVSLVIVTKKNSPFLTAQFKYGSLRHDVGQADIDIYSDLYWITPLFASPSAELIGS